MEKVSLRLLRELREEFGEEKVNEYKQAIKEPMKDDGQIARVEIIVLKYKSPGLEKKCVDLIIENTPHPYKLVVFDNRPNSANTSKAWNKLINEATCNLVCFLDSDAFVTEGWLEPLVEAMLTHQDCIIAAPVTDGSAGGAVQAQKVYDTFPTKEHVSGFCFLTRKDYIKKFGMFNEDFYFYGQDSDLCYRIGEQDEYKMYVCGRSVVYHGEKDRGGWNYSQAAWQATNEKELNRNLDIVYAPRLCQKLIKLRRRKKNEKNFDSRK